MAGDEVIVGAVKKLDVKPGDCVIFETPGMSDHARRRMYEDCERVFPGVKFVICEKMTLAGVLTNPQELGKEGADGERV